MSQLKNIREGIKNRRFLVGAFIKKNKHLPNLEAGKYTGNVEIGVLPSLLLEKTEEQALYIIQLQEQITELNEENEQQNKRLERLEKKECIEN